jgi:hypothetical protein
MNLLTIWRTPWKNVNAPASTAKKVVVKVKNVVLNAVAAIRRSSSSYFFSAIQDILALTSRPTFSIG